MTAEFRIRIVTDQAWRNSYWAPDAQELRRDIKTALREFKSQFPQVKFTLAKKEESWDSPDFPPIRDFPFTLIWDLPKTSSLEELRQKIIERMREFGIDRGLHSQREQQRVRNLANKPKLYQFGFLIGYLNRMFDYHLVADLARQFPRKENEFIFGFTGKVFATEPGTRIGLAEIGGEYALFLAPYRTEMPRTILHELGHLMGADHSKDKDSDSVMKPLGKTSQFDQKNAKIIQERITRR